VPLLWLAALVVAGVCIAALVVVRRRQGARRRDRRLAAMEEFDSRRSALEQTFLAAASATGKPRGLRWTACRLDDAPIFAVDRASAELYALVAATVSFEAVEGGGMEEVEAVGNLRAATAVFVHRGGRWTTDGRAVFNLAPAEAIQHYQQSLVEAPR
jgi:hypothetical protein